MHYVCTCIRMYICRLVHTYTHNSCTYTTCVHVGGSRKRPQSSEEDKVPRSRREVLSDKSFLAKNDIGSPPVVVSRYLIDWK